MKRYSSADLAILCTIAYTDQFQYPLTSDEVHARLIKEKISHAEVRRRLIGLVQRGVLVTDGNYFGCDTRLFSIRARRQKIADQKWNEVTDFVDAIRRLPWITAVFVTGSLAMSNTTQDDDLDFMIIASASRLWLTRLFLLIIASIKGKRRSWSERTHKGWCLNLFLDETSLLVPKKQQSIYQAYEVIQAKPVFARDESDEQFLRQNDWVMKFLPNVPIKIRTNGKKHMSIAVSPIVDICELIVWKLQLLYMRPHRTSEKVSRSFAFFHPRDTARLVQEGWCRSLLAFFPNESLATMHEMLTKYLGNI